MIPPPWTHQAEALRHVVGRRSSLLDMGMGTGKSRVVVDAWHVTSPGVTLIVCPKSVVPVWPREFERWGALAADRVLAPRTGTWPKRVAKLEAERRRCAALKLPLVVVVNYEALQSAMFEEWALAALGSAPSMLVFDESHRAKSPNGVTSKAAARVARRATRIVCLTGTPMPHSPLDVWAQFRMIDPSVFGPSFFRFKTRYAILGGYLGKQVLGFRDTHEIAGRMRPYTYHASRDVLDLPPAIHETIPVDLCPAARRIYDTLDKEMVAWVEEQGEAIVPANALVKLLRLTQLTSGVAVTESGARTVIDSSKREALEDLLDASGDAPFVVFGGFTADLDATHVAATSVGSTSAELSGRQNNLAAWQAGDARVLAVQMKAGGVGIDLTRARYCAYMSTRESLGDYEQSLARVHRPGQTSPVTYYHLISQRTVDTKIQRALDQRRNVVEAVLAMYRERVTTEKN